MSICRSFYVEILGPDGWDIPAEPQPEDNAFCRLGQFASIREGRRWAALFWGDDAIFGMRQGPPPERGRSPRLNTFIPLSVFDWGLCWIPYEELGVDCWDDLDVVVCSLVPVRHILLFRDGRQRFPQAELWEAGVGQNQIDSMRFGWVASEPVDNEQGRNRYDIGRAPPDHMTRVTWMESVADYIGEPTASRFKGLAKYGPASGIRVLSTRG